MDRIASYDRLLEVLRTRIFTALDAPIPLRFRRAGYDDRATAVAETREAWTPVGNDLVWGEPGGHSRQR